MCQKKKFKKIRRNLSSKEITRPLIPRKGGGSFRDSWVLLTPQVGVDLSGRARGRLLELIKARLSLCEPWERHEHPTCTPAAGKKKEEEW